MNGDSIQNILRLYRFMDNQTEDKVPKITKKIPGKVPDKKWIPRSQKTRKNMIRFNQLSFVHRCTLFITLHACSFMISCLSISTSNMLVAL